MRKVVTGSLVVFSKGGETITLPQGTVFEETFQWVKADGKTVFITKAEAARLQLVMPRKTVDIGAAPSKLAPSKEAPP